MNNAEFINTEDFKRKQLLKNIIQNKVKTNLGVHLSTESCLSILSYLDLNKQLFIRTYTVKPNDSLNDVLHRGYSSRDHSISRYMVTPIIGSFDICYRKNREYIGVSRMKSSFGALSVTIVITGLNSKNQYMHAIKSFLIFFKEESDEI